MTRLNRRMWTTALAAAAMALSMSETAAQEPRADSARHRAECRLAAQVLTLGQPADRRGWALGKITGCGPQGAKVLAELLDRYRAGEANDETLGSIVAATSRLVDPEIYETALDLATDPASPTVVRVQAIRVLYFQLRPGWFVSYEGLIRGNTGRWWSDRADGELPRSTLEAAEPALTSLADDRSAPTDVRTAARAVRAAVRNALDCGDETTLEDCLNRLVRPDTSRVR